MHQADYLRAAAFPSAIEGSSDVMDLAAPQPTIARMATADQSGAQLDAGRSFGREAAREAGTHATGTARDDHRSIVERFMILSFNLVTSTVGTTSNKRLQLLGL